MAQSKHALRAVIALALASSSSVALAQETATEATEASADQGDIIVTARRKDESLSRTPVAVQVVTADILEKAQVRTELDLRFATPGLQIRSGQSSNSISYSLRGQSQDPQSDTRPGVLPYFNEIPLAGQGNTTAFYDLGSVQVLKGPQGTLFGRSATGGAVLYTTAKPTNEFEGSFSALAGNYAAVQLQGMVNIPIVDDKLLLRVAGFYSERNGQQRNYYTNQRIGDMKRTGLRGSLTIQPYENFRNTVVFDYFHANGQNTQSVISGLLPLAAPGTPPYLPAELMYAGTSTPGDRAAGIATVQALVPPAFAAFVPAFYDAYFGAGTGHPNTGLRSVLNTQLAVGPYRPLGTGRNFYGATNYLITNTTEVDLSDALTLKNIFGYYRSSTYSSMDVDASPYDLQENLNGPNVDTRQITNELQLSGNLLNDRLSFVTGFFYSNEKTPYFLIGNFFDILLGGQQGAIYHHMGTSETFAGFAQATYQVNDNGLSVTGGIRYTHEKLGKVLYADALNAYDAFGNYLCNTPGYSCDKTRTFKNVNYTIGVQNQFDSGLLVYAATRQAYKNGGFNGFGVPKNGIGSAGGDGFNAQRVRDVEVGAKYAGRLGDVPVRANLALYHSWIDNDQRSAYVLNPGPATQIVNVPKGRTYGLEFDGQVSPTSWLSVGGTFNYTHARFTDGRTSVTTVFGTVNAVYDQVPDTPKTSGTLYADITLPVTSDIDVLLHGDVYNQSKSFGAPRSANNAGTILPSYTLANFRLGVESKDAGWSITGNVKNAFNRTYYVGAFALGEIYQINSRIPGERRTFTVEAKYKF